MTSAAWPRTEWIEHDPDPVTVAELQACSDDELAERFARPLTFGTAGLRGPMRAGPGGMNVAVVCGPPGPSPRCSRIGAWAARRSSSAATPGTAPRSSPWRPPKSCRRGIFRTSAVDAVPTPVVAFAVGISARRGHPDHRVAQPAVRQRLQGVLRRWHADRPANRPRDRGPDRRRRRTPTTIRRRAGRASGIELIQRYVHRAAHVRRTQRDGAGRAYRHARRRRRVRPRRIRARRD